MTAALEEILEEAKGLKAGAKSQATLDVAEILIRLVEVLQHGKAQTPRRLHYNP